MRVGIISDTHGSLSGIMQSLDALGDIDLLLHAGDLAADAQYIQDMLQPNTKFVRGNCDMDYNVPKELLLELEGVQVLLTHGHDYGVKRSIGKLAAHAHEQGAGVCIFGHTHIPVIDDEGSCVFVNPGSPAHPRLGIPTCAVMELTRGTKPFVQLLELV